MKKLNLLAIRIDGGTQARVELNQSVVTEYSEHLKDGVVFPPIIVFHDGADYWLADGFHRYFAHKQNGLVSIEAEVKEGTVRDAKLYAFSANGRRGLSMTWEDNRKIITAMLLDEEWGKWSDVQIAKHIGVSRMTVNRVRKKMEEDKAIEEKGSTKYVKGGKEQEMKTDKIGKKEDKKKTKKVTQDLETISSDPAIRELTDAITQLAEENQLLKDKIAIGQWDASEIEKMDIEEVVTDLRKQIKALEMENETLKTSRDMYQNRNAELMKTVKSLQNQLKKLRPDG